MTAFLLLILVASLLIYKSGGAIRQIHHARNTGIVALGADRMAAERR